MIDKDKDIEKVKGLSPINGSCTIFWSEEGGGAVYRIWDMFFLFEVPQYGGEPVYEGAFTIDEVDKLVDIAYTWT